MKNIETLVQQRGAPRNRVGTGNKRQAAYDMPQRRRGGVSGAKKVVGGEEASKGW